MGSFLLEAINDRYPKKLVQYLSRLVENMDRLGQDGSEGFWRIEDLFPCYTSRVLHLMSVCLLLKNTFKCKESDIACECEIMSLSPDKSVTSKDIFCAQTANEWCQSRGNDSISTFELRFLCFTLLPKSDVVFLPLQCFPRSFHCFPRRPVMLWCSPTIRCLDKSSQPPFCPHCFYHQGVEKIFRCVYSFCLGPASPALPVEGTYTEEVCASFALDNKISLQKRLLLHISQKKHTFLLPLKWPFWRSINAMMIHVLFLWRYHEVMECRMVSVPSSKFPMLEVAVSGWH